MSGGTTQPGPDRRSQTLCAGASLDELAEFSEVCSSSSPEPALPLNRQQGASRPLFPLLCSILALLLQLLIWRGGAGVGTIPGAATDIPLG